MSNASPIPQVISAPQHLCIPNLLETQAERAPNDLAILAPGRPPLTYGHLRTHIRDVVQTFNTIGFDRNDRIALLLPNGPELAVAFLAVASSAICAPLNSTYSADELDSYLTDLHVKAVIVQAGMASPVHPIANARGIRIIELVPALAAEAGLFTIATEGWVRAAHPRFAQPDDVALLLHTAGTTSRPKVVPLTHTNICTAAHNLRAAFQLVESDRCLNVLPLFHTHALLTALLASLVAGGSIVCTPGFSAPQFFAWMAEFRPTWYTAVPTIHQAILAHAATHREIIERCPLRFIRSASASIPPQVLADLEMVFNTQVIETYGMTEASGAVTCNPPLLGKRKIGSVGVVVGPVVAIMDEAGTLLPAGEIGEIVVRGPTVFRGYDNNPEANGNTFAQEWFRTGDQGYLDADGYLFITGRLKEIINRGGEKIAPREVDDVLMDHPAVAQAATFAVPDPRLGEDIAAAVVLHQNASATDKDIRQFAAMRLAPSKVPRRVLIVDDIPKGPTGKVQRLTLAEKLGLTAPEWAQSPSPVDHTFPRTPVEEILSGLWAQVLNVERVGLYDDFFLVGGDSLLATQLISRIRDTLHFEISFRSLFETPIAADMARRLEAASRVMSGLQAPPMQPVPRDGIIPLSFAQERLWFLDQLEPSCAAYNIPAALRLQGLLNVAALAQSLSEIIRRHDILRTTFPAEDGQPVQAVVSARPWTLPVVDLQEVPEHEREVQVRVLAHAEGQRPFDLAQGPLLRVTLLRLAAEEHVLLLTLHHIISDGWSQGVFWRELGGLYAAFAAGRPSPLPELGIQYAEFAVWQRQWLQGDMLDRQLAYWKEHLAGLSMLQLPTDRPHPPVQTFRGARHPVMFSPTLLQGLKRLSQRHGATLFMTLLAAFQALVHRYTGQDDIPVGSFIANRNWLQMEVLMGFFVNTLVLRTDLSGNPSFRELLRRVREVTLGAYSHQDLPYEKLVEELRPPRDLSRNPLFQVLFALRNTPRQTPELAGLTLSSLDVYNETAKFDVTLELGETPEGLSGWFEYNTDLFDAATIARMAGHFQTFLEGIVADPDQRVATLPLLTTDERRRLLVEWNDTAADYPRDTCIHEVFEYQVAQTPDAVAVVCEGEELTYHELNHRANQVAHHLRMLGVGTEVLVGLCLERSLEMVIGLLGILKAGGAYVPLDPAYPLERLAFMVQDAQVSVLLTQETLVAQLPDNGATVICLDSGWPTIARQSEENLSSGVTAENLASVLYTSGSTGRAKGVLGTHRATLNVLAWLWQAYPFSSEEVACQKTSMSFVDSIQELLGPLLRGIQTVLIPTEVLQDPYRLVQTLAAHRVTRILLVPSLLRVLLDTHPDLQRRLPSLPLWFASGEILSRELWQWFQERLPDSRLINLYGASEDAADVTWFDTSLMRQEHRSVPIGRPIANTQVYVLDRHLQPVPIGVPGELYIGGVGLARGYLNRPELTAEKFIPHPFSDQPGARLYKTGDLARYLPDGHLEYLGRLDHQIKIRGFRIELGEIEAVLAQHSAVRQAVVLTREETLGDTRLVAYVVPTREPAPATSELRTFLKAKLPEYMIPSAFVVLETLPLTPNGKVDRNALPQPEGGRPELESGFVAPHDAFERQLTQIWEDLLGVQPIGVQDDFFELGGHSLLAVQLFAHIEKRLGTRLPLVTLFQRPTIAHLADCLRQQGEAAPEALSFEMPRKHTVSDRISHPLARYLPSQYHSYVRRTYRRLKHSSLGRVVRGLYMRQGRKVTQRFLSCTPVQLENTLKTMGITTGDTVLMHSAFRVFNGFAGTPDQVIACVLNVIGESGNLAMVSMPYSGSTSAYLRTGVPFDVRHTRSAMGVITEIFRQTPGVLRSLNPAHPILAWGPAAPWLIADHEHTMYSCGKGSPFEKLVQVRAKALLFDVSLRSMTFFHYVQDMFQDSSPVKLYEDLPVETTVIDTNGNAKTITTYVFSSESRRSRSPNLRQALIESKLIKNQKVGNTKLIVLNLQDVVECAQQMVRAGKSLWKV